MNCTSNTAQITNASILSRQDMMKIFMSIDRGLIRESQRVERAPTNLQELDEVTTELLRANISDNDIAEISSGKKVLILPGEVTKDVAVKVGKVLQLSAKAANEVTSLPSKVKVETIIKNIKGPLAKTFVYSFIPANSDVLKRYPEVDRKRKIQLAAIADISKETSFPVEYVKKHIRNAIVEHYRTNPEQILHDIANGKDDELQKVLPSDGISGLGLTMTEISALITAGGALVGALKKDSAPAKADFPPPQQQQQPTQTTQAPSQPQIIMIPAQQNVTKDPAYDGGKDNTTLYIALAAAGVVVVGGGIFAATRN